MVFSGRSLPSAGEERKLVRVVIVEFDARRRALPGEELGRQDVAVQGLSDEQVLLDTGAPRQADAIVLGRTRPIASVVSLSARLSDAGIKVPMVKFASREPARPGCDEIVHHVSQVLRIGDMLRDLERLVQTIRQQDGSPRGDVVRGALTLRQDGAILWNDIEVPLTPSERVIVRLLAWNFPQFVSCDAIYALGHVGANAAAADENRKRTSVQQAVSNIRRKFRACDQAFRGIRSYPRLGYAWDARVWREVPASQVIRWPTKR